MKQKIISHISVLKNDLYNLAKFLYDNPEESYKEYKSSKYIETFLSKEGFQVESNYLGIATSFKASYGNGYPKIAFICEYDAIKNKGHLTGHNLISEMSIAAALGLKSVIQEKSGTIVVFGCPGEYLGGSKITLCKQGAFKDIDIVLMAHPDVSTNESGTSYAIIPLALEFNTLGGFNYMNRYKINALDALMLQLHILNVLTKTLPQETIVNTIISKGGETPLLIPEVAEGQFYIRSKNTAYANIAEEKIKDIAKNVSYLTGIDHKVSLYELPCNELITNKTLSRLFSHNLKENGIIDIGDARDIDAGLSIGTVSHTLPCIHPYVSIVNDTYTKYGTEAFAMCTLTPFAQEVVFKTAQALAFTALDIIEKENLLQEVKEEFFNKK